MKTILITGSAGFIGFHSSLKFLEEGWKVIGVDYLTNYYDVNLKKNRNAILREHKNYVFIKGNIEKRTLLNDIFTTYKPSIIIHLAAQAGVRYSIDHPDSYTSTNLIGSHNILEVARNHSCEHLLMASTSSVYGGNKKLPYSENDKTENPMSYYAATKKAMEVMSHSYSHLFNIPITCFRFFTVYGPWGRPDMALFKFTKAILESQPIDIYNHGKMSRDFTFIEDLTEAIFLLAQNRPQHVTLKNENKSLAGLSSIAPWRAVNIGNSKPSELLAFIDALEISLGMKARKNFLDIQPGDVPSTFADTKLLKDITGFIPSTSIEKGINEFVSWYKSYFKVK